MKKDIKQQVTEWMILLGISDCSEVGTIANIYIMESEHNDSNLRKFRRLLKKSPIYDELVEMGYNDRTKRFTARQQQLVMMHLGKPKRALEELERRKQQRNKGRDLLS